MKQWIRHILRYARLRPLAARYPYDAPDGPRRHLSPEFFSPKTLIATDQLPDDLPKDLYSIWSQIPGAHKWLHYFETYASISAPFKERPIRMLEIGVYKGASLRMWRNYLHADSVIVGLDIDPSCKAYESEKDNLYVRIGDQADSSVRKIIQEFGPFDLILDDGSHIGSHVIASFNHLFLDGLNSPGVYVVEDTHCNYWRSFRDQRYSFTDLCKDLVDLMHCHYFDKESELPFRKDGSERISSLSVPRVCAEIDEIRFKDSLIVIHKKSKTSLPCSVHL